MARRRDERGGAVLELAIVTPVLLLLVFGIIEFGYGWSQQLNVRHGAREAARLAAVNDRSDPSVTGDAQRDELVAETCDRLDVATGASVTLLLPDGAETGDEVAVEVEAPLDTLTGFFDPVLDDAVVSSSVSSRLEQDATWSTGSDLPCP